MRIKSCLFLMLLAFTGYQIGGTLQSLFSAQPETIVELEKAGKIVASMDGSLLAIEVKEDDKTFGKYRIYRTATGELVREISSDDRERAIIEFSGDNLRLVVLQRRSLKLYSLETGKLLKTIDWGAGRWPQLSVDHRGQRALVACQTPNGKEATLSVFDFSKRKKSRIFHTQRSQAELQVFPSLDGSGRYLFYGAREQFVRRELESGKETRIPISKPRAWRTVRFHDGLLSVQSSNKDLIDDVQIFDTQTLEQKCPPLQHPRSGSYSDSSEDGQIMATTSKERSGINSKVWDLTDGTELLTIPGIRPKLSRDGRYVGATPSAKKQLLSIYNVDSGKAVLSFEPERRQLLALDVQGETAFMWTAEGYHGKWMKVRLVRHPFG